MTDRPIIFSGPMVRALLEGRKTQTRRVLKPQPEWEPELVEGFTFGAGWSWGHLARWTDGEEFRGLVAGGLPYAPGDRLWVREAHATWNAHGQHRDDGMRWGPWGGLPTELSPDRTRIAYFREGFDRCSPGQWRSPIHMPRWASRLTLIVTDVRVQRVQDISDGDAAAEGLVQVHEGWATDARGRCWGPTPSRAYAILWDSLNAKRGLGWDANPWAVALTFEVHRCNIDQMREIANR